MPDAFEFGAVPVYIFDTPWLPFPEIIDWTPCAVLVHESKISVILTKLSPEQIAVMVEYGTSVFERYYTYEGCAKTVLDILNARLKLDFVAADFQL